MPLHGTPLQPRLVLTGTAMIAATLVLALTQATLGSPVFYAAAATMTIAYATMLWWAWNKPPDRRLLTAAFIIALACRAPLVVGPIGRDSDTMRYLWDGRVQRLGYNPYAVVPADPALAHTHTDDTREMPSRRVHTPYLPAAQLFFRAVVTLYESAHFMRVVLVACDVATIFVLFRWFMSTGQNPWRVLAYAWNPLVILEVAHSGHIDALGAFWITVSAYCLSRRRTTLASLAFVLAVTTKLLPIVLAPLYWRRIRVVDALLGAAFFVALYAPFVYGVDGLQLPLGAVPNVVAAIRFNGPAFRAIRLATSPTFAASVAVVAGLSAAAWARWRLPVSEPAAWAWPMATSLAFAPVVYPWYLLYFTPFLVSAAALPLATWTVTVLTAYLVWYIESWRRPWVVPSGVLVVEYGAVILATVLMWHWRRPGTAVEPPVTNGRASV